VKGGVLEHGTNLGARPIELVVETTAESRRPRSRPHEPEQRAERCALTRTVRPEETRDAPGFDFEAESLDRLDLSEPFVKIANLDGGHVAA
jgi:hypothetical protein